MEIDLPDPFGRTDKEGVLDDKDIRAVRPTRQFQKLGIIFSTKVLVRLRIRWFSAGSIVLQLDKTVVSGTHAVVGEDYLHGDIIDPDPVQLQEIRDAIAFSGGYSRLRQRIRSTTSGRWSEGAYDERLRGFFNPAKPSV